jgi:hypothetical protein
VINHVGPYRFAAVGSDSTGNTKNARRNVVKDIPTIINFGDPIHHLNLTIKDITDLPDFKQVGSLCSECQSQPDLTVYQVVAQLRKTLTFFSKSWASTHALGTLRQEEGVSQGLESIGKTRFATVWRGSTSVEQCLPLIRTLVTRGEIHVKVLVNNIT